MAGSCRQLGWPDFLRLGWRLGGRSWTADADGIALPLQINPYNPFRLTLDVTNGEIFLRTAFQDCGSGFREMPNDDVGVGGASLKRASHQTPEARPPTFFGRLALS